MKHWVLTEKDYLTDAEVKAFRLTLEDSAIVAEKRRGWIPIRDWAIFDLALGSGLRVSELCALDVGDLCISAGESSVIVQRGKGDKKRSVSIPKGVRAHLKRYLGAKRKHGEPTEPSDPLFRGRDGRITRTAVHVRMKRWLSKAHISTAYSVHSLRHTYATHLLRSSGHNLRLVQKQLGHSSVMITEVYADVMPEDVEEAVDGLYRDREA